MRYPFTFLLSHLVHLLPLFVEFQRLPRRATKRRIGHHNRLDTAIQRMKSQLQQRTIAIGHKKACRCVAGSRPGRACSRGRACGAPPSGAVDGPLSLCWLRPPNHRELFGRRRNKIRQLRFTRMRMTAAGRGNGRGRCGRSRVGRYRFRSCCCRRCIVRKHAEP